MPDRAVFDLDPAAVPAARGAQGAAQHVDPGQPLPDGVPAGALGEQVVTQR
jgi:hypothetical protein